MSNALHNRLYSEYEAATQEHKTAEGAVTHLRDFATMLRFWSAAMDAALEDDVENTARNIQAAFEHATECERRRKVPKIKSPPDIVRYGDVVSHFAKIGT